jgi:hypothetical protein
MTGRRVVVVRIGVLAIDGTTPVGRRTFGDRLETELGRLFQERGIPAALQAESVSHETLRAPVVPLPPAGISARRLAAAVYDGLDAEVPR